MSGKFEIVDYYGDSRILVKIETSVLIPEGIGYSNVERYTIETKECDRDETIKI